MTIGIHRLRALLIAVAALALSTTLAFGAEPASIGLANAAAHSGKTVPVGAAEDENAGDEDTDESTDEDTDEDTDADANENAGENCSTDPSELTAEELAAMRHGSIVCWAAQQTEWPEWFSNHGAFVKCWAHSGKADAASCTEDPAGAPEDAAPDAAGQSAGHGHGKGHNR